MPRPLTTSRSVDGQPNDALKRTAGSHALAAAAQRRGVMRTEMILGA
jgi:hypothetical protein